ncbi:MAG: RraA family protein [Deltaproteobacteria bacterium]|nr:RraA family protein [Deltaproteobacteria bacterium]MBW2306398.1 RraA family protein [Deltaproteobacteria bacterium]
MKKIINEMKRPDAELIDEIKKVAECYSASCVFTDAQERAGVMRSDIKPIERTKIVGPALTVKLHNNDLVDCLDALKVAQAGDVIVVDANGETETSIWGGLMAGLCKVKGVAGAIVDGAIRDIDEIRDMDFSIFSKAIVPRATHTYLSGRQEPIEINVAISCGGVIVNPGDLIVADEIGVTVIRQEDARDVLNKAAKLAENEELARRKIKEGKTLDELLAEFGRL